MRFGTPLLAATMMAGLSACASTSTMPAGDLPPPGEAPANVAAAEAPDLLVVISVDQLSSDLLEEYLPLMSGGLKRLASQGTLFINGYQAHSLTETCPGHATILTGAHPSRSGIVANRWNDIDLPPDERVIYCAEDPSRRGEQGDRMIISAAPLKVPTLGTYMKVADPSSRNVVISGKDRAAIMLGGHDVDQRWWWGADGWMTDVDAPAPTVVSSATIATRNLVDAGSDGLVMPDYCAAKPEVVAEGQWPVGEHNLSWEGGDNSSFRRSPAYDGAVLALGAALLDDMQLGQGGGTDLLSLGLSATDYVGHAYGPDGGEMCLQMFGLDRNLEGFLDLLDGRGVDYAVMLTSDHGGPPLPERLALEGIETSRMAPDLNASIQGGVKARFEGLPEDWIAGGAPYDVYLSPQIDDALRAQALAALQAAYNAHPQVEAAHTAAEIAAVPMPSGDPSEWTLLQRLRATHDPERSGDLSIILNEWLTPIEDPGPTFISHHSSPWSYDRRVPIIFYRPGQEALLRTDPARTVDILPTLARHLDVSLGGAEIDGVCLDGVHGVRCAD
ncbi:alkaline phosphatase family protein [Sphingomicrobium sediminis]|uniref:Alkaline phosphatase n=1 Tax=Sphingomicrobium sediminis TaxID=2950949 RepID=A0A9X2EJF3_9SPHN|nr:alkaline phosphatase family protein [Sphingomicrobium sediminis]MCM8556699.1 alkaline phosphatase family protein [Sphingomicrobium sediminis]